MKFLRHVYQDFDREPKSADYVANAFRWGTSFIACGSHILLFLLVLHCLPTLLQMEFARTQRSISIADLFAPSGAYTVKILEKANFRESVNLLLDEPTGLLFE